MHHLGQGRQIHGKTSTKNKKNSINSMDFSRALANCLLHRGSKNCKNIGKKKILIETKYIFFSLCHLPLLITALRSFIWTGRLFAVSSLLEFGFYAFPPFHKNSKTYSKRKHSFLLSSFSKLPSDFEHLTWNTLKAYDFQRVQCLELSGEGGELSKIPQVQYPNRELHNPFFWRTNPACPPPPSTHTPKIDLSNTPITVNL